jgi:hypothetical protein
MDVQHNHLGFQPSNQISKCCKDFRIKSLERQSTPRGTYQTVSYTPTYRCHPCGTK